MGPETVKLERTPIISELGIFGTFLRYQGGKRRGRREGKEGEGGDGRGREETTVLPMYCTLLPMYCIVLHIYILHYKNIMLSCNRDKPSITEDVSD